MFGKGPESYKLTITRSSSLRQSFLLWCLRLLTNSLGREGRGGAPCVKLRTDGEPKILVHDFYMPAMRNISEDAGSHGV